MECELLGGVLKRSRYPLDIVSVVTDLNGFRKSLSNTSFDVILVSLQLGDGDTSGLTLIEELRGLDPKARAVLLLDADTDDLVIEAFRKGARGVYSRLESTKNLPKCLYEVHIGQVWADSRKTQLILEALAKGPALRLGDPEGMKLLQKREEEVAARVAEGLTNREIARKLGLSEHTVKNYIFRIFNKLGVSSRAELIIYVLNRRVGPAPSDM